MAGSDSFNKTHFLFPDQIPHTPCKSHTNFLYRSLIIVLVLVFIPMFPSQAPGFISQSMLTKFWELLHLLFIGVAVSYGLFCRFGSKFDSETHSRIDSSQRFFSGISHFSSIFEDGFENLSGSQYESINLSANKSSKLDQISRFATFRNGLENPYGLDREKVTETWNSQYSEGESKVSVANGNYKSDLGIDYKPLGLPIRSLKSRIIESDSPESVKASVSSSSSSSMDFSKKKGKTKKGKARGMAPMNLEERLDETNRSLPSPIPWRSRSGRIEMREEIVVEHPSHCKPQEMTSFEKTLSSDLPENVSSMVDDLGRKKGHFGHSLPSSLSPSVMVNVELPFAPSKSSGFSIGSASEINYQRSFVEDNFQEIIKNGEKGSLPPLVMENVESPFVPSKSPGFSIGSASERNYQRSFVEDEFQESLKNGEKSYLPPLVMKNVELPFVPSRSPGFSISSASERNYQRSFVEDEFQESIKNGEKSSLPPLVMENVESPFVPSKSPGFSISSASEINYQRNFVEDKFQESIKNGEKSSLPPLVMENVESLSVPSKSSGFSIGSASEINYQRSSVEDKFQESIKNGEKSSLPPLVMENVESLSVPSKSSGFSIDSASEINYQRSSVEDKFQEIIKNGEKLGSNSDLKPTRVVRGLSTGKSVRTIRSSDFLADESKPRENHAYHMKEKKIGELDNDRKRGDENLPLSCQKKNVNVDCPVQKSGFFMSQKEEKNDFFNGSFMESKEDSENELDDFRVSSNDEEEEEESIVDEVDKKADEFIAKFREQIRLQKVESVKGDSDW